MKFKWFLLHDKYFHLVACKLSKHLPETQGF